MKMNNIKEIKKNMELCIEELLNKSISLIADSKSDVGTVLEFSPKENIYIIFTCSKNSNKACVYKSKDLELTLKEYWKLIGEEYE